MLPYEYASPNAAPLPELPKPRLPFELGGPPQMLGRNPRTGQPYYEEAPGITDAWLNSPVEIAGGLDTLYGYDPNRTSGERAGGASRTLRGLMTAALPALPAAAVAAPYSTLAAA